MGAYSTRVLSKTEYNEIIRLIRDGYLEHKPNPQIATILVLEANLGCRIGDIVNLRKESFIKDGGRWKINIIEQKTGKVRCFIVPQPVMDFINTWMKENGITTGRLFSITSQAVWKAMRQVTDFLEIDNISTHSLRKMQATNLYEKTHDIELVRKFLNHADARTTQTYIRRSDEQLESAITSCVNIV